MEPSSVIVHSRSPLHNQQLVSCGAKVRGYFREAVRGNMATRDRVVAELRLIADAVPRSEFFATHEVVGSSVLHVLDAEGRVTCKVIDLGKTVPAVSRLSHDVDVAEGPPGSQEEGYLIGLRSLIATWESL